MNVPWFSLGAGLLTYLVTGSAVAAVSLFLVFHAVCYAIATALAQSVKKAAENLALTHEGQASAEQIEDQIAKAVKNSRGLRAI